MAYRQTRRVYGEIAVIPILLMAAALVTRARYRDDLHLVEHTREVQAAINSVLAVLTDAETARRGFLLTGDSRYLIQVDAAGAEISEAVQSLDRLTRDSVVDQQNVRVLEHLANQRAQLLRDTSRLSRAGGESSLRAAEKTGGLAISDQLREIVGKMTDDQNRLYAARTRASDFMAWGEIVLMAAGGIATILLLLWSYRMAQQYEEERDHAEAVLMQANRQLQGKIGEVDQLNRELGALNKELEDRVRERTMHLERSNRDLQQFAYVASHDLQEPLRMIVSYVDLMKKALQDKLDLDTEKYMEFAVVGAKRMQALIRDLLTYARTGSEELSRVPAPLSDVVSQARYSLMETIRETGAEINVGPLPEVEVDVLKMSLVFQNLLSNAIKFRKPGERPRIHIEASRDPAEWRVSVRDEGIGFDAKYAEKIFAVFRRLHAAAKYPGTGIGLAICKRIIEGHGGHIWAESKPLMGTTFFFTVPARTEARRAAAAQDHSGSAARRGRDTDA